MTSSRIPSTRTAGGAGVISSWTQRSIRTAGGTDEILALSSYRTCWAIWDGDKGIVSVSRDERSPPKAAD